MKSKSHVRQIIQKIISGSDLMIFNNKFEFTKKLFDFIFNFVDL